MPHDRSMALLECDVSDCFRRATVKTNTGWPLEHYCDFHADAFNVYEEAFIERIEGFDART